MFSFDIGNKITKEFLLSKNTEETYMAYYLGIPVTKGLFISPLRSDNHKTCSYFRGKSGNLYFKDFATGQCLTFEGVVMLKYSCSYKEALNIIAKDFGYIKGTSPIKTFKVQPKFEGDKQTFIQVEIKDFAEHELKWWNSFGITKNILKKFNVFSCKSVFLNSNLHSQSSQHMPIYGYYFGKKENIEQWRIYYPKKTSFRFVGNVSSKTVQGYRQLPKNGKLLIITKSMKDLMSLYAYGISACAPNSETIFMTDKMLEDLKTRFERIVVLFDTDIPGISAMRKLKKKYPELEYFFIPRKYKCKDFSDLRAMYGEKETKKLIIKWLKNSRQTQVSR